MGVNRLPKTVIRQRRGCDLNPGPSAPESSTLATRLPSHPNNKVGLHDWHVIQKQRSPTFTVNTFIGIHAFRNWVPLSSVELSWVEFVCCEHSLRWAWSARAIDTAVREWDRKTASLHCSWRKHFEHALLTLRAFAEIQLSKCEVVFLSQIGLRWKSAVKRILKIGPHSVN